MFLLILGAVGLTLIVTVGDIFRWLRRRVPVAHCPQCVGFWAGVGCGLVEYGLDFTALLIGFATSVSALFAEILRGALLRAAGRADADDDDDAAAAAAADDADDGTAA